MPLLLARNNYIHGRRVSSFDSLLHLVLVHLLHGVPGPIDSSDTLG